MRIQTRELEEVKLNMTSMIDIVFQLLVFFIMTFKIVEMEGDFNIRMPAPGKEQVENVDILPDVITVQLLSGAEGRLAHIEVFRDGMSDGEFTDTPYRLLTDYIEQSIEGEGDPSESVETEVEFDIDYNLKYQYTVRAIEAVSGKIQSDRSIKKLIEKIKFRDNSETDGDDGF